MTDDLRPRSHLGPVITTAIAVAGAVWGATTWLNKRADVDDVKKLTNDSFLHRLELETMKGEMKALNIRAERVEKGIDALKEKLEVNDRRRR